MGKRKEPYVLMVVMTYTESGGGPSWGPACPADCRASDFPESARTFS